MSHPMNNRELEESLAALQEDTLAEDDNAQVDDEEPVDAHEDPLLLAIDDLEGRVISAIDDVKLHPGIKSPGVASVHQELAMLLRPVLEVAAHTGPSIARTYYRGVEGVDLSVDDVYDRTISELVLPVMLEMAQASTIPATRAAALEFFRHLWQETHKAGSWLDWTIKGPAAGPYGTGSSSSTTTALPRPVQKRRDDKRLTREGEILRYWVQASIACTTPGVFTSDDADSATASRGIIAASASLRPSLLHISQKIKDADDRGANRLYKPVMEMVENVLKKLFLSNPAPQEALVSACVKFLELVILCCSRKARDPSAKRRQGSTTTDFSLDDLPEGHPVIKPEALETIADYAFTAMRGLTLLGGQRKRNPDMLASTASAGTPSAKVVSILKPAALAYLEIESNFEKDKLDVDLDTSNLEFDFLLSQKSYALTLNGMSALALHRPAYFRETSVCLARRAVYLPVESGVLNATAVKVLTSQLRASCLTLLRNAMSVAVDVTVILGDALKRADMEAQAEKATSMAKQAHKLKTAGRAERNKALLSYTWETDEKSSKRQRETDDYIAQMRAAKAARGLGQGIQLPTSMSDAVELILANLENIPGKRPITTSKPRKAPVTLESVVDSIMTNGASLKTEQGKWFERDGGDAWDVDPSTGSFTLSKDMQETVHLIEDESAEKGTEKRVELFREQCRASAAAAYGRIMSPSSMYKSKQLLAYSEQLAARLAFTLSGVSPGEDNVPLGLARSAVSSAGEMVDDDTKTQLETLVDKYPLLASSIAMSATGQMLTDEELDHSPTMIERLLDEALLECDPNDTWKYDRTLELFLATSVEAGKQANEKPADTDRSRAAKQTSALLQKMLADVPRLTPAALKFLVALCDVEEITKKATETHRRQSQSQTPEAIAASAATHAAKVAAEKRATAALLILRDVAFVWDVDDVRKAAVECAAGIASGRIPSSHSVQDKALKLMMNVLYPKNKVLAQFVVDAAVSELNEAAKVAIDKYDGVVKANEENKEPVMDAIAPRSDEEKAVLELVKKPATLYMALCVRRPEMIEQLLRVASTDRADTLAKAVKSSMNRLARACASLHGAAKMALDVAKMTTAKETPLLLSFLENLSSTPDEEFIVACFEIQKLKATDDEGKDPRFIIPVVPAMTRTDLVKYLPDFLRAEDTILMAALSRMSERLGRLALLYRDEPEPAADAAPTSFLRGMTLCEQVVELHKLAIDKSDFALIDITQKRYLAAIKLCLDHDDVYNDRVLMSALDHMSGTFLTGTEKLALGFMRTCILVCTKHESLHPWVAHTLLPRLIDGRIYEHASQWEGWMRCAHMLEKSGESGVNVSEALSKLPEEQAMQYQTKWAGK